MSVDADAIPELIYNIHIALPTIHVGLSIVLVRIGDSKPYEHLIIGFRNRIPFKSITAIL